MKKIDEDILKYLSGLMNNEEITDFENKLAGDSSFKERYNQIKEKAGEFSSVREIELNEAYFNNLLPRVHNKLIKRKKVKLIREYALILPTVITVLLVIIMSILDRNGEIDLPKSLASEVVNNIDDDELADNLIKDYSFESVLNMSQRNGEFEIFIPENVNLSLNSISQYVDFSKIDYSQVENISGTELEKLYNNLSAITFEKVSK
ncbi:MAG: hypothetical protein KGZ42_08685 [Melioribacter sp.]|nr:hypothetical protein [Melioribacter sp.]